MLDHRPSSVAEMRSATCRLFTCCIQIISFPSRRHVCYDHIPRSHEFGYGYHRCNFILQFSDSTHSRHHVRYFPIPLSERVWSWLSQMNFQFHFTILLSVVQDVKSATILSPVPVSLVMVTTNVEIVETNSLDELQQEFLHLVLLVVQW